MNDKPRCDEGTDFLEKEKLHFAVQDGDLERVQELVASGCDVNAFDDMLARTPLHYAAMGEYFAISTCLLNAGANVNAHQEESIGETPLGEIAANCSFEMAELLVKAGADPRIKGWMGNSALDRAAARKKPEGRKVFEMLEKTTKRESNN